MPHRAASTGARRLVVRPRLAIAMTTMTTMTIALLLASSSYVANVESYVVDGGNNADATRRTDEMNMLGRFANVRCRLLMTIGRTPNTDMREFPS